MAPRNRSAAGSRATFIAAVDAHEPVTSTARAQRQTRGSFVAAMDAGYTPMATTKARVTAWHSQAQATMQEIRAAECAPAVGGIQQQARGERRDSLLSLRTMGFREEAALEALRLAEGDVSFAIELLLSKPETEDEEGEVDEEATVESDETEGEAAAGPSASTALPMPEESVAVEPAAVEVAGPTDAGDDSAEPAKAEERLVAVEGECQDAEVSDGTESEEDDWELV
uniref:UBA domain-containing protein n=1 Tax=Prymnesium polylepis TaxID=72548 RepID=A0A6V4HKX8_9EUKA|mmetsp:Transcript_31416/g.85888  ORF Transcript_31416/g.85888 Transcript_31416/m.85888 type:complete len:227 (-) Transcript_31416:143-823(-)